VFQGVAAAVALDEFFLGGGFELIIYNVVQDGGAKTGQNGRK
jgi:hypothetical protein